MTAYGLQSRRAARLDECPLLGEQPTPSGNTATSALNPKRTCRRVIESWPSRSTSLQLFRHPRLAQGIFPSRQHLGLSVRQAVLDALNPKIRVTCAYQLDRPL